MSGDVEYLKDLLYEQKFLQKHYERLENLRFGNVITDICANGDECTVKSNKDYTLEINDIPYAVKEGVNHFTVR